MSTSHPTDPHPVLCPHCGWVWRTGPHDDRGRSQTCPRCEAEPPFISDPPRDSLAHLLDLHDRGVSWRELTEDERRSFETHLANLLEWANG